MFVLFVLSPLLLSLCFLLTFFCCCCCYCRCCTDGNPVIQNACMAFPHTASWDQWSFSNTVHVTLTRDSTFKLKLYDDSSLFNMSYLKHNRTYTAAHGMSVIVFVVNFVVAVVSVAVAVAITVII